MSDESKSLDILGIKPIADSINTVTTGAVDGAGAFLGRICLPAAEEFGFLMQDKVRGWRRKNLAAIVKKAQENLEQDNRETDLRAHPRIVFHILEEGSWNDDPIVQDLWGGLLSSSCSEEGDDDSNLVFISLLSNLTKLQARLLNYVCQNARKTVSVPTSLIHADELTLSLETLVEITGESDIQRLDRELDHLREVGLIAGGFELNSGDTDAFVTPTPLALHMYVRCQGTRESPPDFFGFDLP